MSNIPYEPLRVSGVVRESVVDGPGLRYVLFAQGCPHHCPGCHNPETHDPAGGYWADPQQIVAEIAANPLLDGITLSGGEPLLQAAALASLAQAVKALGKTVFLYSGYTYQQLQQKACSEPAVGELLALADWLVDGPYLEAERDLTLRFRGSRNQHLLDLRTKPASPLRNAL